MVDKKVEVEAAFTTMAVLLVQLATFELALKSGLQAAAEAEAGTATDQATSNQAPQGGVSIGEGGQDVPPNTDEAKVAPNAAPPAN